MSDDTLRQIRSLPNLRGNPLAAVDLETTGREAGYHEIIQIAVVPLDLNMEVCEEVQPFYMNVRPNFPERAEEGSQRVHRIKMNDLLANAPSQEKVLDLFIEWFSSLPLGFMRRLTPLAHNWAFERSFLVPWMGPDLFNAVWHVYPRDTMISGIMVNDRFTMMGYEPPFNRVGLPDMCRKFGFEVENSHDALADALATAKLYKQLMQAMVR